MKNFKEKFYKFMYGRYGIDDLYKFNLCVYLILLFINLFINSTIIMYVELFIIIILFYRSFSKKIYSRSNENQLYLKYKNKVLKFFRIQKMKWNDRNTKFYKKCPKCKTTLRLPLKKGKHIVKCTNCNHRFEVKCRKNEKIKIELVK